MLDLIYFSSVTNMTQRFVEKLNLERPAQRIPLRRIDPDVNVTGPYLLLTPTYGAGNGPGAVPKQVIKFLNDPDNRKHIKAVAAAGNRNFGSGYCLAGPIIARKCQVPLVHTFEMVGFERDVVKVQDILDNGLPDDTVNP